MATLLGTTTIGGHQAIHVGNISSYAGISQAAADGRYLLLSGGTLTGQLNVPATSSGGDHGLRVGAVRGNAVGSQTGDYIMLYERVHIGYPSGWGATQASAPSYGLGTWGSIHVSQSNASGGGIILADDGDIVDLNDAYASMRFSSGVRIYSANRGGSPVITLGSNGVVTANSSVNAPIFYDSDDTNRYLNPSGNSQLGSITSYGTLHLAEGSYYGTLLFGSNATWYTGISQRDAGDAELRIWAKNVNGSIYLATGHDGSASATTLPTDGLVVKYNNVGIGNFGTPTNDPLAKLHIKNSTNGTDALAVDGINGRLFTVTDDLSDSLFSVNTIAGLPVIEAFADNTVKIGKYGSNSITISNSRIAINSDTVDTNFPFYVGDRSTSGSRYILANPGMGFNLADNYAQLQLYGGSGGYIDFVTSAIDSGGRIMWNGNFIVSGDTYFNNTLYTYTLYDRNDGNYYLDMNGTSRLGTVNMNQLSVYGNTYLGDGNGDTTYINDTLYIGANDSGDSHLYFGEGGSPGSDYGAHWYWDSGYTFYWYTRNAGTDRALFNYTTNDTTYLYWHRHFHMNNYEINYLNQIHFNDNVWFVDDGNNRYLNYRWGNSSEGGIKFIDGDGSLQGYVYGSGGGSFGLLDAGGNWKVRIDTSSVELYGTQYATNLYANTFYDRDNSDFYLNAAESSRIRNLYVGDSGSTWSDPGGWGTQLHVSNGPHAIIRVYARDESIETVLFSHGGGQSKVGSGTNHNFSIVRNFSDRLTFYSTYTYSAGYLEAADSLRAPIFYDSNDTNYYLDLNSTSNSAQRIRGGTLHGPNPTWGKYLYVGTDGRPDANASVAVTNGNLHIDSEDGYALYLNYYSRGTIYLGQSATITSDGTYYNGTAAAANSVAWTNVSDRPTTVSAFTNDSGYITSSGRAYPRRSDGGDLNFYWSGQSGQPTWLWGGTDGVNMYVYNPSNFSVNYATSAGNATTANGANGNFYIDDNYGVGVVGLYSAERYQGVFAMGDAYKLSADGTSTGALYGIAWTHTNVGGESKAGLGHQALFMMNGRTYTAIGSGIWTDGTITTTSHGTSANWNTAYGWGNHASAGYQSASTAITTSNIGSQSVNYAASAGAVAASAITGQTGMWTSAARPGPYRLYRNEDNSAYNVQTTWSADVSGFWSLRGYLNDNYHAPCYVARAGHSDTATYSTNSGNADTIDGISFRNTGSNDATNADNIESNGITYYTAGVSNFSGNATDGALYSQAYSSAWQHQIAGDYRSGQIAVRGKNDGTWRNWRTVLDSENYSNWAIARGGDTVSGVIYFLTNNGATLGATNTAALQAYATGGNAAFMSFHRGGSYAINMGLDSDNVFRIGGWSASANRLQMDMSGNLTMAGDVIAFSDARVKTNVQTLEGALEKTLRLRGVSYNRIDSEDTATKIGVIAQEVLEVIPEVVTLDNNGIYGVSYGNIVGLLIEAIKEQQAQIDDLKKQLNK